MSVEDDVAARLAAATDDELAAEAKAVTLTASRLARFGQPSSDAWKHLDRIHAEIERRRST